jgi:hypothetical protein
MARNSEKREKWDMYIVGFVNGKKIKNRGKRDTHTVGSRIWQGN